MNYPVWYVPTFGGGLLIALVAIVHVFVSHFAVGGGLYLVMSERKAIREQEITMGHARALINIREPETQIMVYRQVVKYDFSVRKTEEIVRKISSDDGEGTPVIKTPPFPDEYRDLKNHLSKHFDAGVVFKINELGKGKIEIPFNNPKDLERIIGIFDKLNP